MQPLKRFSDGHKYIYLGVTRPYNKAGINWDPVGAMDFALLPQVLTCNTKDDSLFAYVARFLEDPTRKHWTWSLDIENWVDVTKMPEEEIEKILNDKRKRAVAEKI